MLMYFDSVCTPSFPYPGIWPDSISNAPGGAIEALPEPDVPSPNFLLHFSFNFYFDIVVKIALD